MRFLEIHVFLFITLGLFLLFPALLGSYGLYLISLTLVYIIATAGLNLILGYAGQISLAHGAFMGIGAYSVALLGPEHSFWLALLVGVAIAFILGLALGFPALKVKHHYLAMVTLGVNIIVYVILRNEEEITGGPHGIMDIARPKIAGLTLASDLRYYYFVLAIAFLTIMLLYWILNSQWGRAFKSIRENELRAEMLGVSVRNYKLFAFAIGCSFAAVAGGLFAPLLGFIDPTSFNLDVSFQFLLMIIVGGLGRFEGPFIGTTIGVIIPELLRFSGGLYLILFSLAVIVMFIFMPKGSVALWDWFFTLFTKRGVPQLTK